MDNESLILFLNVSGGLLQWCHYKDNHKTIWVRSAFKSLSDNQDKNKQKSSSIGDLHLSVIPRVSNGRQQRATVFWEKLKMKQEV